MWYAVALAVALVGMYSILAHKDRELSGRAPHRTIRTIRDMIDRGVSRVAAYGGTVVGSAVHRTTKTTKKLCVNGGKMCVTCCTVARGVSKKATRSIVRTVRRASHKIAHPSSRDDSATLAQR